MALCAWPGPSDTPADSLGGGAHYRRICLPSLEHVPRLGVMGVGGVTCPRDVEIWSNWNPNLKILF
jgi:hypothetical protein